MSPRESPGQDSRLRLRTFPSRVHQGEANETQTIRARPPSAAAVERAPARRAGVRRVDGAPLCGTASLVLRQARARAQRACPRGSPQIAAQRVATEAQARGDGQRDRTLGTMPLDRKSTRLNSSHANISYAV